jgi:hypothetical protein
LHSIVSAFVALLHQLCVCSLERVEAKERAGLDCQKDQKMCLVSGCDDVFVVSRVYPSADSDSTAQSSEKKASIDTSRRIDGNDE